MTEKKKLSPKNVLEDLTENVYKALNLLREARELDEEKKWELLLEVIGLIYNGLVNVLKLMDTIVDGVEGLHTRIGDLGNLMDRTNDRIDATIKLMERLQEWFDKVEEIMGKKPPSNQHLL
jgi:hypothetical protein